MTTTRAEEAINSLKHGAQLVSFDAMIKRIGELSGTADEFWLNCGVMREKTPYIQMVYATVVVADFMYRSLESSLLPVDANPLPNPLKVVQVPILSKNIMEPIEKLYAKLQHALSGSGRIKLDGFQNFRKKLTQGRQIIRFAARFLCTSVGEKEYWRTLGEYPRRQAELVSLIKRVGVLMSGVGKDDFSEETFDTHLKFDYLTGKRKPSSAPKPAPKKKPRIQRLSKKGDMEEGRHDETNDFKPRPVRDAQKNPGSIADKYLADVPTRGYQEIPIYSKSNQKGGAKEFKLPTAEHPVIVIETFTDMDGGDVVMGPTKAPTGVSFSPGDDRYLRPNTKTKKRLASVILCETSDKYFYCFKLANKKPHFVLSKPEAREYMKKLLDWDVGIKRFCRHQLKEPLKVIGDHTITTGIQAGTRADSDFLFLSDDTKLFHHYFGNDKLNLDVDFWMETFDKQQSEGKTTDVQKRGFKDGHVDIGWGRGGVSSSMMETQKKGKEYLLAQPALINKNDVGYRKLGNLPDCVQAFCDDHVRDCGEPLMNDMDRDEKYAKPLRAKMNLKRSRFEAYTLVRQFVCHSSKLQRNKFNKTARHTDGPNDTRPGYSVTGVLSFLVEWKDNIYRLTLICYTRASIGNWLPSNNYAQMLKQCLHDYRIEWNGSIKYDDFTLYKDMSRYKVYNKYGCLVPPTEHLSNVFFKRITDYQGVGVLINEKDGKKSKFEKPLTEKEVSGLQWKDAKWTTKDKVPRILEVKIVVVNEFLSRFGFVSSFCYQLNRFNTKFQPTFPQRLQLLYVALLQSSSIQFYYVMDLLMSENKEIQPEVNMFQMYQKQCKDSDLLLTAGPQNRVQAAYCDPESTVFSQKDGGVVLKSNIDKLADAVRDLEAGGFLCPQTGYLQKRVDVYGVHNIGKVQGLSFASICVFTGLCRSAAAVSTAKQALCNGPKGGSGSKNSYFNEMELFMKQFNPKYDFNAKYFQRTWRAISNSFGENPEACENGSCGNWRAKKKKDVFFENQELYTLKLNSNSVFVKRFGSNQWVIKEFPDLNGGNVQA
jgi:hypothetical protein